MAYRAEPREYTCRQLGRMSDYWWYRRDPDERGLPPSRAAAGFRKRSAPDR